ncbi:hypothetical protein [Kutzneria kofuensis]|uniref:Uncharacterized protein n=1 Tax=Kutzneria kofuensis TaxID=103725 RepID=A0A7W9NIF5_9PSEU|nr:hypothetical protein [Kutzneria kofuensis]MBB5893810.1 hypothetical protein [Kutzneria kofuensis]
MNTEKIITGLTPLQADRLACVDCGVNYLRIHAPCVPLGRSATGSQVFVCAARHQTNELRAVGGALR